MSSAVSALGGVVQEGPTRVSDAGLRGMITLRADLADPATASALRAAVGVDMPARRSITLKKGLGAGWMSPDELLILVPYTEVGATLARLSVALAGTHHLLADVSDARAALRLTGPGAREVLAKLSPTDMAPDRFGPGALRRTRLAQVAAAFWIEDDGFTIVCFRSVARYVFDLLAVSAAPGGEIGLWS